MGTDIHGGFIKYNNDIKTPIKTTWGMDRDYTLFAILAGVRNGYGFAGCYRHEPLTPIAEGRGLPDWLKVDEDGDYTPDLCNKWYGSSWGDETEFGTWLGDHSFTHMTVKEILDWDGWDQHLEQGGVVERAHYLETIAKGKNPEEWCGGVSGRDIGVVDEKDFGVHKLVELIGNGNKLAVTHVQCKWQSEHSLREMKEDFLNEVKRIADEYGDDAYLVIGFDS